MPAVSFLLIPLALLLALALILWGERRRRAALAEAESARVRAAERDRLLGQWGQEVQAVALALLGRAEAPAMPARAAEARRLLQLADDVSEYLAAEAGPRHLAPAPLPLAPLLEEAVAAVAAQLGPGRRQFRLAPDFAGLVLHADRRALRGALLQVLTRAARFTREEDWIDLRPVVTADSLAIVIEDEGLGLPAEDLAAGAGLGTRGLGFGLAIARALLEAHGGALRLEAVPGVGARAWLTLPRDRLLAAWSRSRSDGII
ncbi:ATP-binding protein [Siccirubricoccus sp. KC 17139]|uniref:histidine kinase n=1 Tax=Siccirubricoccus soli TaxID=2899147 RepID=A0ABT1DC66_9PROT|nr:ATP-binding protein [Siccirubricoccus soli]MCO6418810.1 ATP-binding protein [Siccirubricoccus soli]MCP2684945.1 ATP-binding protein [Siccirubricoccus soli]